MVILDTVNNAYNKRGRTRQVALAKECHPNFILFFSLHTDHWAIRARAPRQLSRPGEARPDQHRLNGYLAPKGTFS